MRRRELMLLLGGAMTVAHPLGAQQKGMPVIGFLSGFSPPQDLGELGRSALLQGLSETGYVAGQNVAIEYRWAEAHYDRLPTLAADLVSRKVDLIVTNGGTPPALAAKNATSMIPIVFTAVSDPVGIGLVASLARPGGNLTGFSNIAAGLTPKLLELLSEAVPQASVIALLVNPNNQTAEQKGLMLVDLEHWASLPAAPNPLGPSQIIQPFRAEQLGTPKLRPIRLPTF
jgi:putative ABC transport system substrate-binding protein